MGATEDATMGESAYKDPFEQPIEEEDEPDLEKSFGMHEEFISEVGEVLDLPGFDLDGYVGPDGKPQPHQEPAQVAAEHENDDEATFVELSHRMVEAASEEALEKP